MTRPAIAALWIEAPFCVTRDAGEVEVWATGFVSYDPVAQEFLPSCVELRVPAEAGRLRRAEAIEAEDTLASAAERPCPPTSRSRCVMADEVAEAMHQLEKLRQAVVQMARALALSNPEAAPVVLAWLESWCSRQDNVMDLLMAAPSRKELQ